MQHYNRHWRDIPFTREENRFNMQFSAGTLLVLLGVLIGGVMFRGDSGYPTNLYTELISIGVTVFILDLRADWRENRRREREIKDRLIRDAGSTVNDSANAAVDEIRKRGWLVGVNSLLIGMDLRRANLRGARFDLANLSGADLFDAELRGANLRNATLVGVTLQNADLQDAHLWAANLEGASLRGADLRHANLRKANLHNCDMLSTRLDGADLQDCDLTDANLGAANLRAADLRGATLNGARLIQRTAMGEVAVAEFDQSTILPDGRRWSPQINLRDYGAITELDTE